MADFLKIVYTNGKPYTFTGASIQIDDNPNSDLITVTVFKRVKHISETQLSLKTESVVLDKNELLGFFYVHAGAVQTIIADTSRTSEFYDAIRCKKLKSFERVIKHTFNRPKPKLNWRTALQHHMTT